MENENMPLEKESVQPRRAVPVKLIWMLISAAIFLSCFFSLVGAMGSRFNGRALGQGFLYSVAVLMLSLGAGLCMARGCINLSLPGTMSLSALVFASAFSGGMAFFPAMLLALLVGAVFGALNGIFTIQRRRNVQLVTALSSLPVGLIASHFASQVSTEGNAWRISLEIARGTDTVFAIIWIALAIGLCFVGAIGGGRLFRTFGEDTVKDGGGNRFLWSVVAGVLAAMAGIFQIVRMRAYSMNPAGDMSYTVSIFLVLITAGILIPNMRGSYSEALFGFLAVVFAAFAYGMLSMMFSYLGFAVSVQYIVYAIFALLLLIPNLLIYKNKKEPDLL